MSAQSSSNGIGFPSLLTLLFVALKLTHVVNWSWWWVMSPMLIVFGIVLVCGVVVGVIVGLTR
jgi:hypothetical protein